MCGKLGILLPSKIQNPVHFLNGFLKYASEITFIQTISSVAIHQIMPNIVMASLQKKKKQSKEEKYIRE